MTHKISTEEWWETTPESKLELIDGRLIVGTLAGSRRIAWQLLANHGPHLALPMAPRSRWYDALRRAYDPQPAPQSPRAWYQWASDLEYDPEPPPAGPRGTLTHNRLYSRLRTGLYAFGSETKLGTAFGHDFVVRLGDDGLTPDVLFIHRDQMTRLRGYYFGGPPALVIEVLSKCSARYDLEVKRELYERAGVPEYWIVAPATQEITFLRLDDDGRYHRVAPDQEGVYRPAPVDGLALPVSRLWAEDEPRTLSPCWPFLAPAQRSSEPLPKRAYQPGELGWGSLAFVPRVDLDPVPIRFEEYISWCPEAKFEVIEGELYIGGSREGTRQVLGLLLMTFGLVEIVQLAHPRDWLRSLAEE